MSKYGEKKAKRIIRNWIDAYRIVYRRYHGKAARLMGHLTSGYTLQLDGRTHVDGTSHPNDKLWDGEGGDPDMRFVDRLVDNPFPEGSHKHKSRHNFHVSLLNSRQGYDYYD